MANSYIILSNTGAIGGGKRVRILADTWRMASGRDVTPEITLNAKRYAPIDIDLPVYTVNVLVRETESDSNYFSLSGLRAVRFGSTAASRRLKFQDPFGTTHDALWVSAWDPAPALANNLDGSDGWYGLTIRLEEWQ